jgi:hypothetical protein
MSIYEIGVKISMTNAVSGVLAVIAKDALKLKGTFDSLQTSLMTMNKTSLAIGGGLAITGGLALAAGLKHIADNAKELTHELTQLQKLKHFHGSASPGAR